MKKLICSLCVVAFSLVGVASLDFSSFYRGADASWAQLERARVYYEQREYGEALRFALDAADARAHESAAAVAILKKASRTQAIKRIGDDLVRSYEKLGERGDADAVAVLREVFVAYNATDFNNSLKELIAWLDGYKIYPEALFLQGQIHQAEGEYSLAESFYLEARENAKYFDIKEDVYSVLYELADLSYFKDDRAAQEKYLLLILDQDPLCPFSSIGKQKAVLPQMRKILLDKEHATEDASRDKRTVDKFFLLYRHDSWFSLKAYQDLAEYYYAAGVIDRAFDSTMLAASIIMTNLNRSLSVREVEWNYTKPEYVFERIRHHPDIMEWTDKNQMWKTLYYFCLILSAAGNKPAATDFLSRVAPFCDDPEWRVFYRRPLTEE